MLWNSCLVDRVGLTGEGLIKDMDFELNLEGKVVFTHWYWERHNILGEIGESVVSMK